MIRDSRCWLLFSMRAWGSPSIVDHTRVIAQTPPYMSPVLTKRSPTLIGGVFRLAMGSGRLGAQRRDDPAMSSEPITQSGRQRRLGGIHHPGSVGTELCAQRLGFGHQTKGRSVEIRNVVHISSYCSLPVCARQTGLGAVIQRTIRWRNAALIPAATVMRAFLTVRLQGQITSEA